MPILTSREVVLAKKETTYNTDAAPAAADDAILVGNPSWSHEGLRMNERNVVKNTQGMKQHIFGGTMKTISFDVELKGSGAAGTAPDLGVLLEGCSFAETISVGTSVTYDPTSVYANQESLTIWYYQDGLITKITGCRGSVSFNLETGAIPMASFTFTGHSVAPIDGSIVSPTLDSTSPVAVKGNSFTIDSYAATINALTFDMSLNVIVPPDMSASDGFGEVIIGGRDLNGSFDPQAELVATEDFYGNFLSGAQMALATGAIGSTAGNIMAITMPKAYYRDAAPGDRDGIRTYDLPFGAVEDTGDDEVSIVFT